MVGGGIGVSYDYLGHTADLRAIVRGRTVAELYEVGAGLLRDIFVGDSEVGTADARDLDLPVEDPAERFFQFMRELVFLYDSEGFLPGRVESREPTSGPVRVLGEIFDPLRHQSERQVKALTRHAYSFESSPGGSHAVLLFDL